MRPRLSRSSARTPPASSPNARVRAALARPEHLTRWLQRFDDGTDAQLPNRSLGARIQEITAPALIIQGRDDRVAPCESALHLVTHIPDSRLLLLNRCGHWAQIEHAAEFNRLVTLFLAEND